ncbi:hypothetical protein MSAN_01552200 [Mycena sanguinolenta]|uniref:Uncharacterized protein n=1 Tax=Mycena sanguinolenta TaxID=230812 RepID=A0A8H6Y2X6_9AGAR|nr:hypothetical protein MSAN_01552200 [Mycena sanguinolenta]
MGFIREKPPQFDALKAFNDFCEKYHLGDEIRHLLQQHGVKTLQSLLDVGDLPLDEMGFKIGHIAELKWALNKSVLDASPTAKLVTNPSYTPSISGGTGGSGGDSLRRGGCVISGGIGGTGGASGIMPGSGRNTQGTSNSRATERIPDAGPALSGGRGGAGGYGGQVGGSGGFGEAAQITAEDVAYFGTITGGFGGAGGESPYQGGSGGTGQGPRLTRLLFSIDDETRRRLPYTKLEDLGIKPDLCRLLVDLGFQSAGGLFEAHETDFPPPQFKIGHIAGLKVVLRKFAASHA